MGIGLMYKKIIILFYIIKTAALVYSQELPLQRYNVTAGLANSEVSAIYQDTKGYTWFGTNGGISRFDGNSFVTYSIRDGLVYNAVLDISEDSGGNLWIATRCGLSKFNYIDNKQFSIENFTVENGFPGSDYIYNIAADSEGRVFFSSKKGLVKFHKNKFSLINHTHGLANDDVLSLFVDSYNFLWVGTTTAVQKLFFAEDSSVVSILNTYTSSNFPTGSGITAIVEEDNGTMWFSSDNYGITSFNGMEFKTYTKEDGLISNSILGFQNDTQGRLWMCSLEGLSLFDGENFHNYTKRNGLPHNFVTALLSDREGNLWIGTYGKGAARLKSRYFINYSALSGMKENSVFSFVEDKLGNIWLGTGGGGVYCINQNQLTCPGPFKTLENEYVYSIIKDHGNNLWFATRDQGIYIWNGEKLNKPPQHWKLPDIKIFSLFEDRQHNIWIGTEGLGLFCFDGKITRQFTAADGIESEYIIDITQDLSDNIWLGTNNGFVKYDGSEFSRYDEDDGLIDHYVYCISLHPNGELWVGTRKGFSVFNEKQGFRNYDYKEGLIDDNVYFIQHDSSGNTWLGTGKGIQLFNGKIIKDFNNKHGLIENETNGRAGFLDSKGRLWFGTIGGASCFLPEKYQPNLTKPLIQIENVWIGDSLFSGTTSPVLSYKKNELSFDFIGLLFNNEKPIQYQHRLLGYQQNWTKPTFHSRASYTNLSAGDYIFEARALLADSLTSENIARFKFTILHPFWKTYWFITLFIISFFSLLYIIYKLRVYKIKRVQQKLESLVEKRTVELKKSEQRFQDVALSSGDWIWEVDKNNIYTFASGQVKKILGYEPDELIGKTPFDLMPDFEKKRISEIFTKINFKKEQIVDLENWNRTKQGNDVCLLTNGVPIFDEKAELIGYRGVDKDITDRILADEEIRLLNEELEQRVIERTAKLEVANKELKEFAYIVSHDLKAPVRALGQLSHWISKDYADVFDEEGREQMKLLIGRVKRMDSLINGILEYSRIGRIKMEEEPLDLNILVHDVIKILAPPANIEITVEDELPVILGNKTRLSEVFNSLLDNALKYMDKPKGEIRIRCFDEARHWKFSISDNGPGIEGQYHEKIFQVFQTLTPRDEQESIGIGLSLVRKIIELYGGKIWVDSKIDEGSTFYFTFAKKGENNEK